METLSAVNPKVFIGAWVPPGHFHPFGKHPLVANYVDPSGSVVFLTGEPGFLAPGGMFLSGPAFLFPDSATVEPECIRCSSAYIARGASQVFDSGKNFSAANAHRFKSRLFGAVEESMKKDAYYDTITLMCSLPTPLTMPWVSGSPLCQLLSKKTV